MENRRPELSNYDEIAYDTETTGLNPNEGARVFGFSITTEDEDYYWDIREQPDIVDWFHRQMDKYRGIIICHNLSFDYRMSKATDIHFPLDQSVDTCIQACLINEHEVSYSLDNLARKYTSSHKKGSELYDQLAKLFGGRATKNVQMKNISRAPSGIVGPYAEGDTRSTYDLYQWQKTQIAEQDLYGILGFEADVTPILIDTEMHGVRVDIPAAERAVCDVNIEVGAMQTELNRVAKFPCNPQPSGDMKKLFRPVWKDGAWWACDGTPLETTGAGNPSINAEALRRMSHPAAKLILDLRSMIKTRDTFLVGHILESAVNGRVYPTINQNKSDTGGTGTGRLSYVGPALQQIPDRNKKVAKVVKEIFLPDEGHKWVDADMASFEVRMFAHLVGTQDIIKAYDDDPETDFHQFVADLTGLKRNATYTGEPNAKQLNLAMIFNQGKGATAEKMGMSWEWDSFVPSDSLDGKEITYQKAGPEAKAIIDKYHATLPGVMKLADGCKRVAGQRGYIFTKRGRHLRFPHGHKTYKASGLLIQSTSADENKMNWVLINEALKGTGARMLLNIHDSYSLSIPEGDTEKVARRVKEFVEKDRGLKVPLILEINKPGVNWWDSKSSDRWM